MYVKCGLRFGIQFHEGGIVSNCVEEGHGEKVLKSCTNCPSSLEIGVALKVRRDVRLRFKLSCNKVAVGEPVAEVIDVLCVVLVAALLPHCYCGAKAPLCMVAYLLTHCLAMLCIVAANAASIHKPYIIYT